jgi:trigger factor
MKTELEDLGSCRRKLTIELPAERIQTQYDTLLASWSKSASVPGFRKGHAPKAVLEKRFAQEIMADIRDTLIPAVYHEALREKQIDPVEIVDFQDPVVELGRPTTFSVTIEVAPAFDLPDYRAFSIQIPIEAVTEEKVVQMQDSVRRQHATFEDILDRPAQADDMVQVDFTGTLDGKPLDEVDPGAKGLGKAAGFWVSLDEHAFLPGFAEGLKTTRIGDTRTIESTFAPDFTVKGIAGKTVVFQVTVRAIRHAVLPEMNAEFLKPFGVGTVEELQSRIRQELETAQGQRREEEIRNEILKRLLEQTRIEALPETQVNRETQNSIYNLVRQTTQRGVSQDKIVEQKEKIFENASKGAKEAIAMRFILHRIAEKEAIELPPSSLDTYIRMEARRTGVAEDVVLRQLKKQGALDGVREGLRRQAALEWLRNNVSVTE